MLGKIWDMLGTAVDWFYIMDDSTYVPDYWYFSASSPCLCHGGSYSQDQNRGPFCVNYYSASVTNARVGCRLQERPPKAA